MGIDTQPLTRPIDHWLRAVFGPTYVDLRLEKPRLLLSLAMPCVRWPCVSPNENVSDAAQVSLRSGKLDGEPTAFSQL